MTNEALETQDESRISRRNALKAAVGVGVGAVAWSGPQITSFGATPAYAAACTFVVDLFLDDDRNTDQDTSCQPGFGYHPFPDRNLSALAAEGITVDPQIVSSPKQCNNVAHCFTLTYPEELNCVVTVRVHSPGGFDGTKKNSYWWYDKDWVDPDGGTTMEFCLPTDAEVVAYNKANHPECMDADKFGTDGVLDPTECHEDSEARYSIRVRCSTDGADPACLVAD